MSEPERRTMSMGALVAACLAICLAQIALAIPATLNGLFQADLHPIGSQLPATTAPGGGRSSWSRSSARSCSRWAAVGRTRS